MIYVVIFSVIGFFVGIHMFITENNKKELANSFFEDEIWNLNDFSNALYEEKFYVFGFILGTILSNIFVLTFIIPFLVGANMFNKYFWKFLFNKGALNN